jgi:hypothetical protein
VQAYGVEATAQEAKGRAAARPQPATPEGHQEQADREARQGRQRIRRQTVADRWHELPRNTTSFSKGLTNQETATDDAGLGDGDYNGNGRRHEEVPREEQGATTESLHRPAPTGC